MQALETLGAMLLSMLQSHDSPQMQMEDMHQQPSMLSGLPKSCASDSCKTASLGTAVFAARAAYLSELQLLKIPAEVHQ